MAEIESEFGPEVFPRGIRAREQVQPPSVAAAREAGYKPFKGGGIPPIEQRLLMCANVQVQIDAEAEQRPEYRASGTAPAFFISHGTQKHNEERGRAEQKIQPGSQTEPEEKRRRFQLATVDQPKQPHQKDQVQGVHFRNQRMDPELIRNDA